MAFEFHSLNKDSRNFENSGKCLIKNEFNEKSTRIFEISEIFSKIKIWKWKIIFDFWLFNFDFLIEILEISKILINFSFNLSSDLLEKLYNLRNPLNNIESKKK